MDTQGLWPPSPPDGYEVYEDAPEGIPRRIRVTFHLLVAMAIVGLLYLSWTRLGGLQFADFGVAIGVVVFVLVVTVIHEAVHALVSRIAGWETVFRVEWDGLRTAPSVQSYGAFQERQATLLFYLAPALTLTTTGIPMVISSSPVLSTLGVAVLITAWTGSISDFYNAWFVAQLPADALEHHHFEGDVEYYAPE